MTSADARQFQAELEKRGVKITLDALELLTVDQARAAMRLVDLGRDDPECPHCNEPVLPWKEQRPINGDGRIHQECMVRAVAGSVGHQLRQCSCYRPAHCQQEDPIGLSKREAARRAYDTYKARMGL